MNNCKEQARLKKKQVRHPTQTHTLELLQMYRIAIGNGRFQRVVVAEKMGMSPNIAEGRWYGEIKRTQKHGQAFDWKAVLNVKVMLQLQSGDRSTALVDRVIQLLVSNPDRASADIELLLREGVQTAQSSPRQSTLDDFKEMDGFLELFCTE